MRFLDLISLYLSFSMSFRLKIPDGPVTMTAPFLRLQLGFKRKVIDHGWKI